MSISQRKPKLEIILQVLRDANEALSLPEIYEEIKTRTNLDVSQKTIERDILEMIQKGIIIESSIKPRKVSLWGQLT